MIDQSRFLSAFRRPAKLGLLYLMFLFACALFAFVLIIGIKGQNRIDVNAKHIAINELANCQRLTTVQVASNKSNYADWVVFNLVLDQSTFQRPQKLTPAQQKYVDNFYKKMRASVAEKSWVPIVDCVIQAKKDGAFVSPPAVKFNDRLPPPSALGIHKK